MDATEMEDRVARLVNHPPVDDAEWAYIKRVHRHVYAEWVHKARKHIRAMRDATDEMVDAHIEECAGDADEAGPQRVRKAWAAMIDAATPPLQETPAPASNASPIDTGAYSASPT